MDRSNFFYRQKVSEAELDEAFDDAETAMQDLATDIGLEGIIGGAVITENSPTGMTVLASASCRGYDQAGQRIYYAPQQTVDCSVDYLGVSTTPAAGKYATLMLTIAFDRLLDDLRTDGNGASVYYRRYESFAIKVTKGADAAASPSTPPSAPSDELILCDIEIQDVTANIVNAMIDTSRRQDFQWTDADKIGVTAGAWTKIDSAVTEVQSALDSVDTELISRDASGYIDEHLLPDGATRDLGSASYVWGEAHVTDETIYNSILAAAGGETIGSASKQFAAFLSALTMYGDILPNSTGADLGSAAARFDAFLEAAKVYGSLLAGSNGIDLGDASNRFDAFLNLINYYGNLGGTFQFSSPQTVTLLVPVNNFESVNGTDWDWDATGAYLTCTAASKSVLIYFDALHGADIDTVEIRWAQASSTGMGASIASLDEDNAVTPVGSSKTITTIDGSTNWDTIDSGLAETVDLAAAHYRVGVSTLAAVAHKIYMLRVTYNVTSSRPPFIAADLRPLPDTLRGPPARAGAIRRRCPRASRRRCLAHPAPIQPTPRPSFFPYRMDRRHCGWGPRFPCCTPPPSPPRSSSPRSSVS